MNTVTGTQPSFTNLTPGDPAPWFRQRSGSNPAYVFDTAAGRYIVLCFYGSAGDARGRNTIKEVLARRTLFDDVRACFFGVSLDPQDEAENRVADSMPGLRFLWDFDATVSRLYGAVPKDAEPGKEVRSRRFWIVLDPMLRVLKVVPFADNGRDVADLFAYLETLPPPERFAGFEIQAPILILPNVFEPDFCRHLIDLYEKNGGEESGFVRQIGDKTVMIADPDFKRRKDFTIDDPALIKAPRRARNPEGAPFQGDAHGALHRLLLRGRGWRSFPPAPRQHHQGHGPSPLRRLDQPQRRLRRRRGEFSGIRTAQLQGAGRRGGRVLDAAAACRLEGDARPPLRLPAIPLR
jgi:peroxiredoxin